MCLRFEFIVFLLFFKNTSKLRLPLAISQSVLYTYYSESSLVCLTSPAFKILIIVNFWNTDRQTGTSIPRVRPAFFPKCVLEFCGAMNIEERIRSIFLGLLLLKILFFCDFSHRISIMQFFGKCIAIIMLNVFHSHLFTCVI